MPKFDYLLDPDRKAKWAQRISQAKLGVSVPKISVGLKANYQRQKNTGDEVRCPTCGEVFRQGRQKNQKFCGYKCRLRQGQALKLTNPFEHRIWTMSNNLLLLNRRAIVRQLVESAIGKPCPYCGVLLSIQTVSMDHKEPYGATVFRRFKAAHEATRRELDRLENLHIVCRQCNSLKGALNDAQFKKLLEFLSEDLVMKEIVLMRLRRAAVVFGKRWNR